MKKKKTAQKRPAVAATKKKASAKPVSKNLTVSKPSSHTHELPVTQMKRDLTMILVFAVVAVVSLLGMKYSGFNFEQVQYLFRF